MTFQQGTFDEQWHSHDDFVLDASEKAVKLCTYAQAFATWVGTTIEPVLARPNLVTLNQSKVLVADKYFDFRAAVPKAHRDCFSERRHHCIWHVFERVYQEIRLQELKLTPPMLFIPAAQSTAPTPQDVVDVLFGLSDEENATEAN